MNKAEYVLFLRMYIFLVYRMIMSEIVVVVGFERRNS
jgi:hypothetical protein